MKKIKSFGIGSAARFYAALMGLVALAIGLIISVVLLSGALLSGGDIIKALGSTLAFVVLFPLLYAVLGLVFGALFAFLYNITAGKVGGIEIDLE